MLIMIIPWKMQSTSWTLLLLQLPIRRQLAAAMANLWLYFHNILQYLTIIWNIPIKYILYIYIYSVNQFYNIYPMKGQRSRKTNTSFTACLHFLQYLSISDIIWPYFMIFTQLTIVLCNSTSLYNFLPKSKK